MPVYTDREAKIHEDCDFTGKLPPHRGTKRGGSEAQQNSHSSGVNWTLGTHRRPVQLWPFGDRRQPVLPAHVPLSSWCQAERLSQSSARVLPTNEDVARARRARLFLSPRGR